MFFFKNFNRFKKKFLNKKKFKLNGKINFGNKKTNNFFDSKLKKAKFYFEFGSGGSTLIASKYNKKFISIELDKSFYLRIKNKIKNNNIRFINLGPVGEFSYPIFKNKKKIKHYVESINEFISKNSIPDLILIDGRFRVACCLNLLRLSNKQFLNTTIMFNDYEKRKNYTIIKDYFNLKKIGRMVLLLSKKKCFS